jgi:phage/plasmid-associated DNA primase
MREIIKTAPSKMSIVRGSLALPKPQATNPALQRCDSIPDLCPGDDDEETTAMNDDEDEPSGPCFKIPKRNFDGKEVRTWWNCKEMIPNDIIDNGVILGKDRRHESGKVVKKYTAFYNHDEARSYLDWCRKSSSSEAVLYSAIVGSHEVRPYLDFDIPISASHESEEAFDKAADKEMERVCRAVESGFLECFGKELDPADYIVFDSSRDASGEEPGKFSFHLEVSKYRVKNNTVAEQLAMSVRSAGALADTAVYTRFQMFRAPYCNKLGKLHVKVPISCNSVPDNRYFPNDIRDTELIEPLKAYSKKTSQCNDDVELCKEIVDKLEETMPGCQVQENSIGTVRIIFKGSTCILHERVHDNDNGYLFRSKGRTYFCCNRSRDDTPGKYSKSYLLFEEVPKIPQVVNLVLEYYGRLTVPNGTVEKNMKLLMRKLVYDHKEDTELVDKLKDVFIAKFDEKMWATVISDKGADPLKIRVTEGSFLNWMKQQFPSEHKEFVALRTSAKSKERVADARAEQKDGEENAKRVAMRRLSEKYDIDCWVVNEDGEEQFIKEDVLLAQIFCKIFENMVINVQGSLFMYMPSSGIWSKDESLIRGQCIEREADLFPVSLFPSPSFLGVYAKMRNVLMSVVPRHDNFFDPVVKIEGNGEDAVVSTTNTALGLLLFNNGVLCMKTMELLPNDPKYRFTRRIARDWVKPSQELIENVKKTIFDKPFTDKVKLEFLLISLARSTAGHYSDKRFFPMLGETDSGKGVLTDLILKSLDEFATTFNAEELIYNPRMNFDSAREFQFVSYIHDRRIAISNELKFGKSDQGGNTKLSGNMIKRIAGGGDKIATRVLKENPINVINQATMFILCNDIPEIVPADDAVLNRACYTEMDRSASSKITEDNANFFVADDKVKNLYVLRPDVHNAFIGLMCAWYQGKPVKPECIERESKQRIGQGLNLEEWLSECFETYEDTDSSIPGSIVDGQKIPLKRWYEGMMVGDAFTTSGVKMGDFYIPFNDVYEKYNERVPISSTRFSKKLSVMGYLTMTMKIKKKSVKVLVGIKAIDDEENGF